MLKDEWLTPPEILTALGPFDLDPCAPVSPPWRIAHRHYTIVDDGLANVWFGRVWLNPPYGKHTDRWLSRLAAHGNGLALIFARTETETFFEQVWSKAAAVLFLRGRLHFHHVNGTRAAANAGAPSVLVAYDQENAAQLRSLELPGQFIPLEGRAEPLGRHLELVTSVSPAEARA
jgi:hypothetical protein